MFLKYRRMRLCLRLRTRFGFGGRTAWGRDTVGGLNLATQVLWGHLRHDQLLGGHVATVVFGDQVELLLLIIAKLILLMPAALLPLAALARPHGSLGSHRVHMHLLPYVHCTTATVFILALQFQTIGQFLTITTNFSTFSYHQCTVAFRHSPWSRITIIATMVELVNVALSVQVNAWIQAMVYVLIDQVGVSLVMVVILVKLLGI